MKVALIIFVALVLMGVILYIHHRITSNAVSQPSDDGDIVAQPDEKCCGMHITCEKDSLSTAISTEIVYYDDEELDRYKGREANDYTEEEIEQFRDVLLTLLPQDIAGWGRSIQLRGITLPTEVRDELLLIVAEARQAK